MHEFASQLLVSIIGDKPLTAVSRQDCRRYRDMLTRLPANLMKRYRGIPLEQVRASAMSCVLVFCDADLMWSLTNDSSFVATARSRSFGTVCYRGMAICDAQLIEAAHQADLARTFADKHCPRQERIGILPDRPLHIADGFDCQCVVLIALPPQDEKLISSELAHGCHLRDFTLRKFSISMALINDFYRLTQSIKFGTRNWAPDTKMSIKYRPDIDGLRAIAVLAVIFYHGNIPVFTGGFTGVDIFFVISGYLITKIIASDLEVGRFSLRAFYDHRVRRILPALLFMMTAVLAVGYLSLLPDEFKALGKSAFRAALFTSNIFFSKNTGYFDGAADEMPLLHTWSLAIEEQFYLVWPLVLIVVWKLPRSYRPVLWAAIAIAACIAFYYSVHDVVRHSKKAFYLANYRSWELLLGGALAIAGDKLRLSPPLSAPLSLIGLGAICWGVFGLTSGDPFPGYNALFPCLGTALVIWTGSHSETPGQRILSVRLLQFIGKISYSLYLWHWPIFVFYRIYAETNAPTVSVSIALIGLSCMAAVISWRFIEQPFRVSKWKWRVVFPSAAVATAVVAGAASIIVGLNGLPNRLPSDLAKISDKDAAWKWECPHSAKIDQLDNKTPICVIGAPWETAKVRGVLWGDSHAEHFAPVFDGVARDANISLVVRRDCPAYIDNKTVKRFFPEIPAYSARCAVTRDKMLSWLANDQSVSLVVLAAAWSGYPTSLYRDDKDTRSMEAGAALMGEGLKATIQAIPNPGREVLLVSDVPTASSDIARCVLLGGTGLIGRHCNPTGLLRTASINARMDVTNNILRDVAQSLSGVRLVVPQDGMCDQSTCPSYVNDEFIYLDSGHIRRNLSEQTDRRLAKMIGLDAALNSVVADPLIGHASN